METLGATLRDADVAVKDTNLCGGKGAPMCKMVSMLERRTWLQLGVFRLRFFESREFGISVFPEVEEILICASSFRNFAKHRIGSAQLKMGPGADRIVLHKAPMIEDFSELGGGFCTLVCRQQGLASQVNRMHKNREGWLTEFAAAH